MRRPLIAIFVLVLIVLGYFYFKSSEPTHSKDAATSAPSPSASPSNSTSAPEATLPPAASAPPTENLNLATDLNAPGNTVRKDLEILNSLFGVWQTNFLHSGNPVGENREITAALTGHNSLHVAFISPQNPAINSEGELCDRWGTPFRFHQLGAARMEIRSAGPDKKFGTEDDATFTPN